MVIFNVLLMTITEARKNPLEKTPVVKVGQEIKIHKHAGIYVSGKITSVKNNYITYESDRGDIVSGGDLSHLLQVNDIIL